MSAINDRSSGWRTADDPPGDQRNRGTRGLPGRQSGLGRCCHYISVLTDEYVRADRRADRHDDRKPVRLPAHPRAHGVFRSRAGLPLSVPAKPAGCHTSQGPDSSIGRERIAVEPRVVAVFPTSRPSFSAWAMSGGRSSVRRRPARRIQQGGAPVKRHSRISELSECLGRQCCL